MARAMAHHLPPLVHPSTYHPHIIISSVSLLLYKHKSPSDKLFHPPERPDLLRDPPTSIDGDADVSLPICFTIEEMTGDTEFTSTDFGRIGLGFQ